MTDPIRFSSLKLMGRSPAHYAHNISVPFEQTGPMRVGSAIDGTTTLVIDGEECEV